MSSDIVMAAEGVGKRYRLGERARYHTLRDSIATVLHAPVRLATRHGRNGSRHRAARAEYVWALEDVSFAVPRGDVLGVIGRNGAGKSTLLKVVSGVTEPTKGRAALRGRVGSLLEVGTGFHPELTGRENVFLSGAILGMKNAEIRRKFDEIIAFAEVERFVDTPVKHYSSGMYLRLGFAVAAHLEAEVLLIDEVLAVGDAAFQKRCMGKIGDVAHEGRTVLFVSHNMTAINQLCPRSLLLDGGHVVTDGPTSDVVAEYLRMGSEESGQRVWDDPQSAPGGSRIKLRSVSVVSDGSPRSTVDIDREVSIEVEFWNFDPSVRNVCANVYLLDDLGRVVLSSASTPAANALPEEWYGRPHPPGLYRSTCTLPANFLNDGRYVVTVYVVQLGPVVVEAEAREVVSFEVFDTGVMREPGGGLRWDGVVRPRLPWTTELVGTLPEGERR